METTSLAIAPDPSLERLLIDLKNKPMDHRALQQQAVLAFGRRTNAQPPLPVLLQDAVAWCARCSIALRRRRASPGRQPGVDLHGAGCGAWRDRSPGVPLPRGRRRSMAAFALGSGNVTVAADLRAEPRFRDGFLRGRGVVGALAAPLHVNARPFGVLGVYTDSPRQFSSDDVTFAETIAHLLSASIARIKAEQKLQEVQRNQVEPAGHGRLDGHDAGHGGPRRRHEPRLRRVDQVPRWTTFRDRPFWQAMVAPDDAELVKLIFRVPAAARSPASSMARSWPATAPGGGSPGR